MSTGDMSLNEEQKSADPLTLTESVAKELCEYEHLNASRNYVAGCPRHHMTAVNALSVLRTIIKADEQLRYDLSMVFVPLITTQRSIGDLADESIEDFLIYLGDKL